MKYSFSVLLCFIALMVCSQVKPIEMDYEPSDKNPFGMLNPAAPPETGDFDELIGICDCKFSQRNSDGTWQKPLDMVWQFKYIMNGWAVQDEVWREEDNYAGSIRQYLADSSTWAVIYFSSPGVAFTPSVWHGGQMEQSLVFTKAQKAANGMDGYSKLSFHDINENGFKWTGEWIDENNTFIFPFRKIECIKRKE